MKKESQGQCVCSIRCMFVLVCTVNMQKRYFVAVSLDLMFTLKLSFGSRVTYDKHKLTRNRLVCSVFEKRRKRFESSLMCHCHVLVWYNNLIHASLNPLEIFH